VGCTLAHAGTEMAGPSATITAPRPEAEADVPAGKRRLGGSDHVSRGLTTQEPSALSLTRVRGSPLSTFHRSPSTTTELARLPRMKQHNDAAGRSAGEYWIQSAHLTYQRQSSWSGEGLGALLATMEESQILSV
jgi:hypothetical protein